VLLPRVPSATFQDKLAASPLTFHPRFSKRRFDAHPTCALVWAERAPSSPDIPIAQAVAVFRSSERRCICLLRPNHPGAQPTRAAGLGRLLPGSTDEHAFTTDEDHFGARCHRFLPQPKLQLRPPLTAHGCSNLFPPLLPRAHPAGVPPAATSAHVRRRHPSPLANNRALHA